MATDIERLVLEMTADVRKFENALNRSNNMADKRLGQIEKRFDASARRVTKSAEQMGDSLRNTIAGLATAAAIREVGQYADAWTNAENKLSAAGVAAGDLAETQQRLVSLAIETRSPLEATVDLYARMTRSTQELGVSQEAVARSTEVALKAFKSSGQSAAEAAATVTQLGQALGSGTLAGDELKSIRENSTILAQAIAKEFGVSVGELKKLGEEGELTSARVFRAIVKAGSDIDAQFAKTNGTIADSFTNMETRFTAYIARLDDATDASAKVAGFVNLVANNLDALSDAAVIAATVIGGTLAGQAVAKAVVGLGAMAVQAGYSSAAITTLGRSAALSAASMNVLRGAMAFFGGPVGLAVTAIVTAVGLLAWETNRTIKPTETLTRTTTALEAALQGYEDAALAAALATGKDKDSALEAVNAKRALAIMARDAAAAQLTQARATLALVAAQNAEAIANERFSARGDAAGTIKPAINAGRVRQAKADAEAAAAAIASAEKTIGRIDQLLTMPGGGMGGDAPPKPDKDGKKAKGQSAEDLARRLADLKEEQAIDEARARGDIDRTRELERQADIRDRTRRYEEAGLAAAEASRQAIQDSADLEEARAIGLERQVLAASRAYDLELARLNEDHEAVRSLERREALQAAIEEHQENGYDLTTATNLATGEIARLEEARARLRERALDDARQEHDIHVATLIGDEQRVRLLERELEIRERSRRYQEEGGLTPQAAGDRARNEVREIDEAELRGKFRGAFRDGVQAAIEGDLGGAIEAWAEDFGEALVGKASDLLADVLFDQMASLFPDLFAQLAQSGGDLAGAATMSTAITTATAAGAATMSTAIATSSAASGATIGTAISASGSTAAAAMGTAILTAGQAAAAAMAAAIAAASAGSSSAGIVSSIAGAFHHADGGSLVRGSRNIINERGAEPVAFSQHAVAFSTAAMKGLSDLGNLARQGVFGGGGGNIEVNNYGPPAKASVEKTPGGDMKINLVPMFEGGVEAAGQSGKLRKALSKSPQHKRRG